MDNTKLLKRLNIIEAHATRIITYCSELKNELGNNVSKPKRQTQEEMREELLIRMMTSKWGRKKKDNPKP